MPPQKAFHNRLSWRPGQPRTWPIESETVEIDSEIDRLVVVSDLHAYREPLGGVDHLLQSLPGTYAVFVNGDLFEGGLDPVETIEWVRANAGGRTTRGNHDSAVFAFMRNQAMEYSSEHWMRDGELGVYQSLTLEQLQFVADLPDQLLVKWRGMTIRLFHGHWNHGNTEYTDWQSTPDQLMALFHDPGVDCTAIGHTHYPFVRDQAGSILANSGSVSVPIQRFQTADGVVTDRDALEGRGSSQPVQSSILSITDDHGELRVEIVPVDFDRIGMLKRYEEQDNLLIPFSTRKTWVEKGLLDLTLIEAAHRGEREK
jgi:predicted phosphodiesterase